MPSAGPGHALLCFFCVIAGNNDERQSVVGHCQPGLNLESAHSGHMQVENYARRALLLKRLKKFRAGRKRLHRQSR